MPPVGGIASAGALNLEKPRHCEAPSLLKRRKAVLWVFMVEKWRATKVLVVEAGRCEHGKGTVTARPMPGVELGSLLGAEAAPRLET